MGGVRSYIFPLCVLTPFLVVFLELGFHGLSETVKVEMGACRESFPSYHIAPFIPDLLCPYMKYSPCGSFTEEKLHNVHARMLECLCRDKELHHSHLTLYHNTYYLPTSQTTDVAKICRDRPRERFPR